MKKALSICWVTMLRKTKEDGQFKSATKRILSMTQCDMNWRSIESGASSGWVAMRLILVDLDKRSKTTSWSTWKKGRASESVAVLYYSKQRSPHAPIQAQQQSPSSWPICHHPQHCQPARHPAVPQNAAVSLGLDRVVELWISQQVQVINCFMEKKKEGDIELYLYEQ